jgi:hypothetical protein
MICVSYERDEEGKKRELCGEKGKKEMRREWSEGDEEGKEKKT